MSKKSTKSTKEVSSYETRDVVLGKVRGFPPWPGMVVDPDTVPDSVAKERPTSKKTAFYCVQFFPTGDYAWLVAKDISKLKTHEIESYINEPYKKSGELLSGYRIALDPKKWEEERDAASHEAGEEEANAEIDQLDSENDDGEAKQPAKPKKRKRESDAASSKAKVKTKTKKGSAEPVGKKKSSTKGKKNGAKAKTLVESEDEGDQAEREADDDDRGRGKISSPPTKRSRREKEDEGDDAVLNNDPEAIKVREWRHKLQKTFLSNKALPKEEDMPALDALFTTVENYDKINIQYLSFSKIGKVMRHIAVLGEDKVPRDGEFKFRERAKSLVDKWHQILNANKPNGAEGGGANGATKSEGGDKEETVTQGTAALDLNGTVGESPVLPSAVDNAGDTSVLADVTMSEA